jgi:hypothetical protein
VVSLALKEMLYRRGIGDGRMVGEGVDVGIGTAVTISTVAVGLGGKVGNLRRTVGVGVLGGRGVGVGTRVLVVVGSAGVGVSRLAVGKDLGKAGVRMTVDRGKVGVGWDGKMGKKMSTSIPIKTNTTKPIKMPIVKACERVIGLSL